MRHESPFTCIGSRDARWEIPGSIESGHGRPVGDSCEPGYTMRVYIVEDDLTAAALSPCLASAIAGVRSVPVKDAPAAISKSSAASTCCGRLAIGRWSPGLGFFMSLRTKLTTIALPSTCCGITYSSNYDLHGRHRQSPQVGTWSPPCTLSLSIMDSMRFACPKTFPTSFPRAQSRRRPVSIFSERRTLGASNHSHVGKKRYTVLR